METKRRDGGVSVNWKNILAANSKLNDISGERLVLSSLLVWCAVGWFRYCIGGVGLTGYGFA